MTRGDYNRRDGNKRSDGGGDKVAFLFRRTMTSANGDERKRERCQKEVGSSAGKMVKTST